MWVKKIRLSKKKKKVYVLRCGDNFCKYSTIIKERKRGRGRDALKEREKSIQMVTVYVATAVEEL